MLNHHLAGLLGLGCLSWAGHQIHIAVPINALLDAGVDPKEIPLPHEFLNPALMRELYPRFSKGLLPFFTLDWAAYGDFLTFRGGLNPVTGGLWLTDTAHHHLALAVLFLVAGHMYQTNWEFGHSLESILKGHRNGMITRLVTSRADGSESKLGDLPPRERTANFWSKQSIVFERLHPLHRWVFCTIPIFHIIKIDLRNSANFMDFLTAKKH